MATISVLNTSSGLSGKTLAIAETSNTFTANQTISGSSYPRLTVTSSGVNGGRFDMVSSTNTWSVYNQAGVFTFDVAGSFLTVSTAAVLTSTLTSLSLACQNAAGSVRFMAGAGPSEIMRAWASGGVSIGNTTDPAAAALTVTGAIYASSPIFHPDGAVGAPGVSFTSDPDTGLFSGGANIIKLALGGTTYANFDAAGIWIGNSSTASLNINTGVTPLTVTIPSVSGIFNGRAPFIQVGRNTNSTGGAGSLSLVAQNGTAYFIWVDTSGKVRVDTSAPTASDTTGTIVGTQS